MGSRHILPEAFGLLSHRFQRVLGIRPFDVQLAGGAVLHHGGLVELATGRKTSWLSAIRFAVGKGVDVTMNDYLAKKARRRDGSAL